MEIGKILGGWLSRKQKRSCDASLFADISGKDRAEIAIRVLRLIPVTLHAIIVKIAGIDEITIGRTGSSLICGTPSCQCGLFRLLL